MAHENLTRRDLIKGGVAATGAVTLGSLTGCLGGGGGGSSGNVPSPSSTVPASAEAMVTMDFAGMYNDGDMKDMGNTMLSTFAEQPGYNGPETVDAALDEIQNEAGLDPRGLLGGTVFMKVTGMNATEEYTAMVINTDWSESDLISALEDSGTSFTEGTYAGQTVYEPEMSTGSILGVLSEGSFAIGSRPAVEDAIDVSAGNTDAVSGDLLNNFNSATNGYMTFASTVPESQLPSSGGGGMGGPQIQGLSELQAVSGSVYKQGGNFGLEINMHTADSQSASDLSESLDDLTGTASMMIQDPTALTAIEKIQFSSSGSTATVTYEESVSKVKEYVQQYANQLVGTGFGGGVPLGAGTGNSDGASTEAPLASFGFDYDENPGSGNTVTVTHQSGDHIQADEIQIRGRNLGSGNTGSWESLGGTSSGTLGGDAAVVAGDSLTLTGVQSDYTVRIVWRGSETSSVLSMDDGPDA